MSLGIGTAGYKRLVKAARIAFKNDHIALGFAKVQLRAEFLKNKNVSDPSQLAELSKGIDEAEELLAFHIVQGRKNSYNTYEVELSGNNIASIESEQSLPHGPELAPVDTSVLGTPVIINSVKQRKT